DLFDPGGVGDLAVLDRDVHVHADKHHLAVKLQVVDRVEIRHGLVPFLMGFGARARFSRIMTFSSTGPAIMDGGEPPGAMAALYGRSEMLMPLPKPSEGDPHGRDQGSREH